MNPHSKSISNILIFFALLASLLGSALTFTSAYAVGAILVNSNADTIADDGSCTLREAITNANADSQLYATAGECAAGAGADTITFAADYTITLTGSQLPAVSSTIIINGNGEANTIIQASTCNPVTLPGGCTPANYRVFEVGGDLTLDSLTVRNGRCNGLCALNPNSGGGVYNDSGILTVSNATFSANSATYGGGMYNTNSNPTLTDVTFSANSATSIGGGMDNNNSSPTLTNVTFSANSATSIGGGMDNTNSSPTLTNVTFSANSAPYGGGMYNYASNPMLMNVTFSANSADFGGGMYNYLGSNPTLTNTIVANSASGGDCVNETSTLNASNNLIEDTGANACDLTNGTNGNIIGGDPGLGALANNGGFTQTFALLSGSPAINKGTNIGGCVGTDQRGVARPQGAKCDIGAYEFIFPIYKSQGTYDGWTLESTETSNAGGTLNATTTTFNLGDNAQDKQYRAILSFNTSGLPDTAVITKVTLKIRKQGLVGTDPFTILGGLKLDMRKPFFGTTTGLVIGDFQAAAGKSAVATFNATPVSNWYSALLNATGRTYVNKTGITQFRLRFATDDNNDNGADYMKFYSGDYATASARPTLIIEYYVP